jgi:Mg2+ and Co2+ transporter CorA
MTAIIIDALGVRHASAAPGVRDRVTARRLFWLDIFDCSEQARDDHLAHLEIDSADLAWALRFGQAGRMQINANRLRAVTWMAEPDGNLIEVHVYCSRQLILTLWKGNSAALDRIRAQFAERINGFGDSSLHAAAILLQLLLGTLDYVICRIDASLTENILMANDLPSAMDISEMSRQLQRLQSLIANFTRYGSAVRNATVGIEALPDVSPQAAAEFDDYAEQVEDVEEQFYERRRWMADRMRDYATAIAQRQGEEINRLTLVNLVFLPLTALTGFFGMNFDWMVRSLNGPAAFFGLGVALPTACVALTILWIRRKGLLRPRSIAVVAPDLQDAGPSTKTVARGQPPAAVPAARISSN